MHAGDEVGAHLEQKDRQGKDGGNGEVPRQFAPLGFLLLGAFVAVVCAAGGRFDQPRLITGVPDGGDEGGRLGVPLNRGALGR